MFLNKLIKSAFSKTILFLVFLFSFICLITSCSSKSNNLVIDYSIARKRENEKTYQDWTKRDGLLADAISKANFTDNVLMYSINWNSVLYKYGGIAHIIKVLEINPNKEIYVFSKKDDLGEIGINKELLKPILDNKQKFPNFNWVEIPNWNNYWSFFEFHRDVIEEKFNNITNRNLVVDFYLEDFQIMNFAERYINIINNSVSELSAANEKIFNGISLLLKMRSVNMIADGNTAFSKFSTSFFNFLNQTNNYWDQNYYGYPLSESIRNIFSKNDKAKIEELRKNRYYGGLILQALFTLQKNDKNGVYFAKYFLPGCESILDMNDPNGKATELSNVIKQNNYFDPFYSVDANIIDLYDSFTLESKKLFLDIFKIVDQDQSILNNKKSIIYSGRLISYNNNLDNSILEDEAKRILKLYNLNGGINNSNLQLLFKAHPREDELTISKTLIDKINEIDPNINVNSWLKFLNKNVPMEYYIFSGFLKSIPEKNREIIYYAGYSTTIYIIVSAGLTNSIKNVIVSDNDMNYINRFNGYPSRVFPENKLVTNNELFN
ncbi:hypothetical protein [Mycoplasmoides pirum]|uniref:hypothetical protein n=1 Tax=Mycoplasmoides pirum TaxID=2122 RepID=UPI000480FB85|nr:hypothetical protein [Mycoplasmoides pirum]